MVTRTGSDSNIEIGLPASYCTSRGQLVVHHEEDALCWFWAYPWLLPWPASIQWLYTPVVDNRRWPGDLWGIDDRGELLVIECKQVRRRDDPFLDFVEYHRRARDEFTAEHWREKWERHLKAELSFPEATAERPDGKTGGILPRSNKREHIRRWPALAQHIDVEIRSIKYRSAVENALSLRAERGNPPPHYLALMVKSDDSDIITDRATKSAQDLMKKAGAERVHLFTARADVLPRGRIRISARAERTLGECRV